MLSMRSDGKCLSGGQTVRGGASLMCELREPAAENKVEGGEPIENCKSSNRSAKFHFNGGFDTEVKIEMSEDFIGNAVKDFTVGNFTSKNTHSTCGDVSNFTSDDLTVLGKATGREFAYACSVGVCDAVGKAEKSGRVYKLAYKVSCVRPSVRRRVSNLSFGSKCLSVRRLAVLDSGASHHMSGVKDDFQHITDEKVYLKVADRKLPVPARLGVFRENSLDLKVGLFHPDLKALLVSTTMLESDGKVSILDRRDRRVETEDGLRRWKVDRQDSLPVLSVNFQANKSSTAGLGRNGGSVGGVALLTKKEKDTLRFHERCGHFYIPGVKVNCPACQVSKGQRQSHAGERPKLHVAKEFCEQVDWDFKGKYPPSTTGNIWNLDGVDEATGWAESYPVAKKSCNAAMLERFCGETCKAPKRVRCDNAKEFKEPGCKWRAVCTRRGIKLTFSPPYTPQLNGVVERFNRTNGDAIRANLIGVDKRVWDYAAKFSSYVWNRIKRGGKKKSPYQKRFGREAATSYFRRFGCLCYAMVHTHRRSIDEKYERGIFLGYGQENSTYLVGVWREDDRTKTGLNFVVLENADVKFDESVLIRDVDDLKKFQTGTFVPYVLPGQLGDSGGLQAPDVAAERGHELADRARRSDRHSSSSAGGKTQVNEDKVGELGELHQEEDSLLTPDESARKRRKIDGESVEVSSAGRPAAEKGEVHTGPSDSTSVSGEQPKPAVDDRVVVGPDGVVRKKRGRKPGTKAQTHWKKPGRKPKNNSGTSTETAVANAMQLLDSAKSQPKVWGGAGDNSCGLGVAGGQAACADSTSSDPGFLEASAVLKSMIDFHEEEEAVLYTVQVTPKEAFSGPDADRWIEADTLERTQLEALNCWRDLKDGELTEHDEVIPAVVIYTRKRCGRFKARCVALGNRQTQVLGSDIYSPTISHAGNKYVLVESAARGHYLQLFDISNAFIKASLEDEKVIIKLPQRWGGQRKRLLKSLYGLKIAPRKWFDTYRRYLEGDNWAMCEREPGLFRKGQLLLTVYVDDSVVSGPDEDEVIAARDRILEHFPGKVIKPVMEGSVEVHDVLGATVRYDRKKRWLKISLEGAVDRALKKFNMEDCKTAATPCVGQRLDEGSVNDKFPIRSIVGVLQYIATMVRCDITYAVQRVARSMTPCHESTVTAAKRILQYLKGTKSIGLEYSPKLEREFRSVYAKVAKEGGKELPDTVAFSDADFAGCTVTLRSTSGSILYHRGCPIVWSSKRQTVRASSTCESEYVAIFDSIKLCQSQGFLDWFLEQKDIPLPLVFTDNQSALSLSQAAMVTKKSKHISLRYHVVRDHFKDLCFCPTQLNKADPLTKPLAGGKYLSMFKCYSVSAVDMQHDYILEHEDLHDSYGSDTEDCDEDVTHRCLTASVW